MITSYHIISCLSSTFFAFQTFFDVNKMMLLVLSEPCAYGNTYFFICQCPFTKNFVINKRMFLRINILLDYEIVLFYIKITNSLIFNMARSKKHFNFCYILTGTPYAIFNKKKWIIKTLLPIKYLYIGLTQRFDYVFTASCTIRFVCYIILRRNNFCRL